MSKQRAHRKSNGTPFFFRYFLSIVLRVFLSTRFSRPNTKQGYPHKTHVILKGFTSKNLSRNESIVRSLTYVRDDKQCHSEDRKGGRISSYRHRTEIPRRPTGLTRNDKQIA